MEPDAFKLRYKIISIFWFTNEVAAPEKYSELLEEMLKAS